MRYLVPGYTTNSTLLKRNCPTVSRTKARFTSYSFMNNTMVIQIQHIRQRPPSTRTFVVLITLSYRRCLVQFLNIAHRNIVGIRHALSLHLQSDAMCPDSVLKIMVTRDNRRVPIQPNIAKVPRMADSSQARNVMRSCILK